MAFPSSPALHLSLPAPGDEWEHCLEPGPLLETHCLPTHTNPCYVGGRSRCRSRSPLIGTVSWCKGSASPFPGAVLAGWSLGSTAGPSSELCWYSWAGAGAGHEAGSTPEGTAAGRNASTKAILPWKIGLPAEVWGFVCAGNLYGGVEGCPGQCGSLTEELHPTVITRLSRAHLLRR